MAVCACLGLLPAPPIKVASPCDLLGCSEENWPAEWERQQGVSADRATEALAEQQEKKALQEGGCDVHACVRFGGRVGVWGGGGGRRMGSALHVPCQGNPGSSGQPMMMS